MKIECVKEKLGETISRAEKVTAKNASLPILSGIFLEAKNNELTVKATNLDLGIEIKIPVKVEQPGSVVVPGSILNAFLSGLSQVKSVVLETHEGNMKVVTSNTSTIIKTFNSEDFPTIPVLTPQESKVFSIPAADFVRGLKAVWYSSAASSIKPELSSIYIHIENDMLIFAATDSFRLAEKKIRLKKPLEIPNLLIPIRNMPDIVRILEQTKGDVKILVNNNQIAFEDTNGLYLTSRLIDGTFPDYRQIIPKEAKTTATLLKQDFVNTLKMATIFSDKFNKLSFALYPGRKKFVVTAQNPDVGESSNTLDAVCEGEDLAINFNHKYVADCLASVEADSLSLEFNGLSRPLVIKGINDQSFLYLVMPINK
jgi:DNA polymerase-3 subunit beta